LATNIASFVNDLGRDKSRDTGPGTIRPVMLIDIAHLLAKRSFKKSRRNRTPAVFNCVGLLINWCPGC